MKNLKKSQWGNISLVLVLLAGLYILYQPATTQPTAIGIGVLAEKLKKGEVKEIVVKRDTLTVTLANDEKATATKESEAGLSETLKNYGVTDEQLGKANITVSDERDGAYWLATLLPILLPILVIGGFLYFMMRQAGKGNNQAMNFGGSKARVIDPKDQKKRTLFTNVAGNTEAKEELWEVVEFLKEPKKFKDMGAKIPKGVLLLGPPGTGKTLMAKAVAGEAGVPFFAISGSEFVEMFVGVGASRVRDLFKQAKKLSPSIVFIDEIDAVGRHRGAGLGGGHDEREQTLNQILVEMDGFETDENVIVIASTNRPDVLDPALLRPGRFDRRVTMDLPDIREREEILAIHAKGKPFAEGLAMRTIAERTAGFSGADLQNLLNEAAILATRRKGTEIVFTDVADAIEKVMLGPARRSRRISDQEKKTIAYHEAGHALVASHTPHADPVHKVSIISRGHAGGYTMTVPSEDKTIHTSAYFRDELAVLLGGYSAEKLIFGDTSTGPSNDLERATQMARNMVTRYGMSELGMRTFGKKDEMVFLGREMREERNYSDDTANKIDELVTRYVQEAFTRATAILVKERTVLDKLTEVLLKQETIEQTEYDAIVGLKSTPAAAA